MGERERETERYIYVFPNTPWVEENPENYKKEKGLIN